MARRIIAFLLLAGGAAAIAAGLITGFLPVGPFNAERWRQGEVSSSPLRLTMIGALTRSGRLDGLTRAEVAALLGPQTDAEYFADWDLRYWLGPERGLWRIDSEWLVIRFGGDGRVREYRIVRD